jgi:two-component system sensor histidine kinase EvgS
MLLDKNLLEKGQFSPQLEHINLSKLVSETVAILQGQASLKNIEIKVNDDLNGKILNIDSLRTQQILINLISNAIKFSCQSGLIEVAVSSSRLADNVVQVALSVRDYGIGITETDLQHLF